MYRLVLATQLVHSLQQLVTVCTDRLPASQPCTVASTGYSVPATQPCTLASTTGYRVYRLVLATQLVHSLQQLVTVCTDRLPASQPCTVASTGYSVPATQPCTLASTTGYRVYRLVLATQLVHSLQQLVTLCTDRLPASQPCTVASTGYSVPATQHVHWLQQLVTGCTGWYWLHSLVHLLQQLATECTGWYWLHSLVHLFHSMGYKSTNRVLATQSLLYSASTQLVT